MTSVLLLGDFPTVGLNPENFAIRVAADISGHGPAAALALAERTEPLLRDGRPVLVVYPSWRRDTDLPLLRMLRGLLDGPRLGLVPLNLPPLALSFVADQLALLSTHIPAGEVAAIAPRLARAIASGAWLSSVARFEHADTGLRAHVRSYLPGSGFMVTLSPDAAVHRITATAPVFPWPGRLADPVMLLLAGAQGDLEWANTELGPSLAAQSIREAPVQPHSAGYWGTAKFTEFVAWSGHAQTFPFLHALLRCQTCRWCGEKSGLPECSFCGMVQPPAPAAPESPLPDLWLPSPALQPPAPARTPPSTWAEPTPPVQPPPVQPQVVRPQIAEPGPPGERPANGRIVEARIVPPPVPVPQPPPASAPPSFGTADPSRDAEAYQWYPDQARPRG